MKFLEIHTFLNIAWNTIETHETPWNPSKIFLKTPEMPLKHPGTPINILLKPKISWIVSESPRNSPETPYEKYKSCIQWVALYKNVKNVSVNQTQIKCRAGNQEVNQIAAFWSGEGFKWDVSPH